MNQVVTTGIIINRVDYGEADRILTMLTPDQGKLRVLAKGVRRIKSKLAGGIELFSVSQLSFVKGRGDISTLTSSRLVNHYSHIVSDLDRTMLGYDLIRQLDRATEEGAEEAFFDLLEETLRALDNLEVPLDVIRLWFKIQLLDLGGRGPNLQSDENGRKLQTQQRYDFDPERMTFRNNPGSGRYTADHIKILRMARGCAPAVLAKVRGEGLIMSSLDLLERV